MSLVCKEVTELASDHLAGELSLILSAEIRLHQLRCGGCAAYLLQMFQTVRLLRALPPPAVPPESRERAWHSFHAWRRRNTHEQGSPGVASLHSEC